MLGLPVVHAIKKFKTSMFQLMILMRVVFHFLERMQSCQVNIITFNVATYDLDEDVHHTSQ